MHFQWTREYLEELQKTDGENISKTQLVDILTQFTEKLESDLESAFDMKLSTAEEEMRDYLHDNYKRDYD